MPTKVSESRKMAMTMCPANKYPYKKDGKFTSKFGLPLCRRKPKKVARKPMAHAMAMPVPVAHAIPMAHAMPTHFNPRLPVAHAKPMAHARPTQFNPRLPLVM